MESTVLVKAFSLLEATADAPQGKHLAQLAGEVGLTKPTAHRILKTLTMLGYVERLNAGVYRQTGRLRQLVSGPDDRALLQAADPILAELHAQTHETVNLGVLRHGRVVYLNVLESEQPLRRVAQKETSDPIHCTALGRAIASQLPPQQQAFLLRAMDRPKRTSQTVVDVDALLSILETAQRDGFAVECDQTDLGVTCIGAPVFDEQKVAGAISLSIPTARAEGDAKSLIAAVKRAAQKITQQLKHNQPPGEQPCPVPSMALSHSK